MTRSAPAFAVGPTDAVGIDRDDHRIRRAVFLVVGDDQLDHVLAVGQTDLQRWSAAATQLLGALAVLGATRCS